MSNISNIIKIVGIDPALRNTGLALATFDLDTNKLSVQVVSLLQTANEKGKVVSQASDDFRCARVLLKGINDFIGTHGVSFAVAEIPGGSQSARACTSNGVVVGMMAGLRVPLIEVNPAEVKRATGLTLSTKGVVLAKEKIIEWAVGSWPEAGWLTRKLKGEVKLIADNEHLADACAIVAAGVNTVQFAQAVALMASVRRAA